MGDSSGTTRVLLVDDEPDIVTVFKTGLEKTRRYSVDAFNDPRQALSHFLSNSYHAIILDINMPEMTGFELARAIWEKDPAAKICFLTAFEIYKNEAEKVFTDFKQHCFIKKPISVGDLAKHIEVHLNE